MAELTFKPYEAEDAKTLLGLFYEMADYEGLLDQLRCTEADLKRWILDEKMLNMRLICEDGVPVGYVCWYYNFSSFLCKPGLYLEDVYIQPAHRGKGYTKAALKMLARTAVENDCERFEWVCLDWNEHALKVYESFGAKRTGMLLLRLDGENLKEFAKE